MTQDIHTGQWLPFYLRDHMAGATAGVNLFDRVAGGHGDHGVRAQIAQLRAEIDQDRMALGRIMAALGIRQISLTMLTGVLGEVAGRFKPNGYLTGRSPGADVLELEALTAAVQGKARMWETLVARADRDPRLDADQLRDLLDRATAQGEILIALHARIVRALPDQ